MSNVLPCPCEFNGDLVRFRVRTDWGLAIFCAAEIRLKLRCVVAKSFPYCLTVKMKWRLFICFSSWSIRESMSSDKSSRSEKFVGRSPNPWPLIRAPDRNKFVGRLGEALSSKKSFGSQRFVGRSESHIALIRALDRRKFSWWSGSQWALIRASGRKRFVGR